MAINTENKRRSVQAYWVGAARPVPDGAIGAADRATSAWFYAGITYALPSAVADILLRARLTLHGLSSGM